MKGKSPLMEQINIDNTVLVRISLQTGKVLTPEQEKARKRQIARLNQLQREPTANEMPEKTMTVLKDMETGKIINITTFEEIEEITKTKMERKQ